MVVVEEEEELEECDGIFAQPTSLLATLPLLRKRSVNDAVALFEVSDGQTVYEYNTTVHTVHILHEKYQVNNVFLYTLLTSCFQIKAF